MLPFRSHEAYLLWFNQQSGFRGAVVEALVYVWQNVTRPTIFVHVQILRQVQEVGCFLGKLEILADGGILSSGKYAHVDFCF